MIGEETLRQRSQVDAWLDELTQLDVDGFYLIVRRSGESYRQQYDPQVLISLLRVCYSLSELNQYKLFVGYTDMVTLLLHAVGVTGTAAGWFTNLRQFGLRRFQPVSGGRQPRPRYSSRPLLNSIYMTELDVIYQAGYVSDVLSGTEYDAQFDGMVNPENVPWLRREAALHHWSVLADIAQAVAGPTVGDRLDLARRMIGIASSIYAQLAPILPFPTETGPAHLDQWLEAVDGFRSDAAV